MEYFKRNPDALPTSLGILIFIGLLIFASVTHGVDTIPDTRPKTNAGQVEATKVG